MNVLFSRLSVAALIGAVVISTASSRVAPAAPVKTAARPAAPAPSAFGYHWCVTGRNANSVNLDNFRMFRKDVVCFYEHRLGLYPRLAPQVLNGGIPQRTNIAAHLARATQDINRDIPDPNWTGFAVIDYESWCPVWSVVGDAYRNASIAYTREQHPELTGDALEQKAREEFTIASKNVMLQTIELGKRLRPRAKWGFYAYPGAEHPELNDQIKWLFDASQAIFPSIYHLKYGITTGTPGPGQARVADFAADVRTIATVSRRLAGNKPILGFVWMRYHDVNHTYALQMLNPDDMQADVDAPKAAGFQGIILWDNLDDTTYTQTFKQYFNDKFGPAVTRAVGSGSAAATAAGTSRSTPRPPPSR